MDSPAKYELVSQVEDSAGEMKASKSPDEYLNIGQLLVVMGYAACALVCIFLRAPLLENANRPGFIGPAQLPPVFLFAAKNSPLTALLLGPGGDYTKLNYLHRWSPVCYHTPFWPPWILLPLGFYTIDLMLRFLKFRHVVGYAEAVQGGMTLIRIPLAQAGWRAGQHVQVRVLLGTRAWESHPPTVCRAPHGQSCLTGPDGAHPGMLLAPRACGDWSTTLHVFATAPAPDDIYNYDGAAAETAYPPWNPHPCTTNKRGHALCLVLDGPYGGPALRPASYARVPFFSGGSGATVTLSVLDALVAACVTRGRPNPRTAAEEVQTKTTRVLWCWCIQSLASVQSLAPQLRQIAVAQRAQLRLRIRIYLTRACGPAPNTLPPK
ncbi:hypothetical protein K438DRAFT_2010089 [Mycena galopus ATCC 62051]|nr:hypothetical protein K438DRAFT_2010089 [Mycena galopus ATCC 62051]